VTSTERDLLRQDLIRDEGLRLTVYTCPAGYQTIGVGRNLEGRGITRAEALVLLDNDIKDCLDDLGTFAWWGALNPVRQRALLNMRFQLGSKGFRGFTQMLAALDRRDYAAAATAARESKWARTDSPQRATRVTEQIETGAEGWA
jgi:lysozyme